jgi:hypothetical protein
MARGPDALTLLERALGLSATGAGIAVTVADAVATRWASATFSGCRHVLDMILDDTPQGRAWLASLVEADLPIRGHLLADCAVVRRRHDGGSIEARVEALTVESP